MPLQILTLKFDGITAGDYLAWCRAPHTPALGFALRSPHADTAPLGDTVTTTLDGNQPAPPPPAAVGLPPLTGTRTPVMTWAAAAIDHPSSEERDSATHLERRPATRPTGHRTIAGKRLRAAPADQARRRHDRHRSEGRPAEELGPARMHPTGAFVESRERTQVKHELALALSDLGGATFALAYHGALNNERLVPRVQRIRDLFTQLSALDHPTHTSQSTNEPELP
jgi:hypothetical protein